MPRFSIELTRELITKISLIEETTIIVEAEYEHEAMRIAEDMADNDEITTWEYVDEHEEEVDYNLDIEEVVELPPAPYRPAPNQINLF